MKPQKAVAKSISALPSQWKQWEKAAKKNGKLLSRWVQATLDASVKPSAPVSHE